MVEALPSPPPPTPSRVRTGALLGALVGPPLLILVVVPLIHSGLAGSAKTATGGVLYFVTIFASWAVGVLGLPLLGASLAAGRWVGRTAARRLANHCIGGSIAGGILSSVVLFAAPALRGRVDGDLVRIALAEACLMAGVVLCFREEAAPGPES